MTIRDLGEQLTKCHWLVNENFALIGEQNIFEIEKLVRGKGHDGYLMTYFNQAKCFSNMNLSAGARQIKNSPNAGGSSVESEVLSFEIFKVGYNAKLLKTEMQVPYFPAGGSLTDYVMKMFDQIIGVSVTRAMKFDGAEFTIDDADYLLRKKLRGIHQAAKNSLFKWSKQLLHVWLFDESVECALLQAWSDLDVGLKRDTILVLTLATNSREIFFNKIL
jgi:hypothetical protein